MKERKLKLWAKLMIGYGIIAALVYAYNIVVYYNLEAPPIVDKSWLQFLLFQNLFSSILWPVNLLSSLLMGW